MTAFWVGDVPSEDLVVEPARRGEPIEMDPFSDVDVTLRDPHGDLVESAGFFGSIVGDHVVIEWPAESVLEEQGRYDIGITLSAPGGARAVLAPLPIIVQADDGWHNLDSIQEAWDDAANLDDEQLFELLEIAKQAVLAYAEALELDQWPPTNYWKAQAMQAQNVWNSSRVNPVSGGDGDGSFVLRPFPLDWQIKQLLRPQSAVPVIA